MMKVTAILIAAFFYSNISLAQIITDLDPVSVTSSRTNQKVSTTGRQVSVIEGKEIALMPVMSVDELLKYISGVEVQQRGIGGSHSDISIRGGTFQQVLVLVDGMKINDPITGHFSAYFPVDPSQIDRIEIVKGTASAIYGAEAVGGVIHIITKTYSKFNKEKTNSGNVGVAGGEFGYYQLKANLQTTGKINFSLAGTSTNAAGQKLRSGNARFNSNIFSAGIAIQTSEKGMFYMQSSYDDRGFNAQNFYTTFKSDTATEHVKTWWNHLKYKTTNKNNSEEFDLVYKQTSDHYQFNSLAKANDNESKLFSLQYIQSRKICNDLQLSFGSSFENKKIISNDRGDHYNNHIAVFSSGVYSKKNLTLNPGLRLDYDQRYQLQALPQISIAYRMNQFNFRALAGRSIRAADFTERFNNYNKTNLKSGSIGNPELDAEKAWNYEAGIDYIHEGFKISLTGFYRDQKDVIDWVTTSYSKIPRKENLNAAGVFAFAQNIKTVKTSGVETEIQYQQSISANSSIRLSSSVTFLNSETGDSITSFYIVSHAHTIWQQNMIFNYKKFTVSSNGIYKKRKGQEATAIFAEITPSYWLWNAKLQYRFRNMDTFVAVNNISNASYSDLLGSIMPRRWTTIGFSLAL